MTTDTDDGPLVYSWTTVRGFYWTGFIIGMGVGIVLGAFA